MAVVIKTKNNATGTPSSLQVGELAVNTTDGKLFVGSAIGGVLAINSGTTQVLDGTAVDQTLRWNNGASEWQPTDVLKTSTTTVTVSGTGGLTTTTGFLSEGVGANSFRAGSNAGLTGQGSGTVAVGLSAGSVNQSGGSVAIGNTAGQTTQGGSSVAIGKAAGKNGQGANGIIINSKGIELDDTTVGHIHIASTLASLDYDTVDGKWTATDSVGTFDLNLLPRVNTWTGLNTFTAGLKSPGAGTDSFRAGTSAGLTSQGASSVAIGSKAGQTNQHANSIIISSKGSPVNTTTTGEIHIVSNSGSMDYTDASGWTATDTDGTFDIKDNPILNAVTLGAVGDADLLGGGTDDTAAFAAMDATYAGRTIDLLNRNYNINSRATNAYQATYINGKTYDGTQTTAAKVVRSGTLYSNLQANEEALFLGSNVGTAHKVFGTEWSTAGATKSVGVGINVLQDLTNGNGNIGVGALIMPVMTKGRYNTGFGGNTHVYQDNQHYTLNNEYGSRNSAFGVNTYRFARHGYRNCIMGRNAGQDITAEVTESGGVFTKLQAGANGADGFPTYKTDPNTEGAMGGHHIVAVGDGALSGFGPVGIDGVIKNDWPMFAPYQTVIGGLAGKFTNFAGNTLIGGYAGHQVGGNNVTAVGYQAVSALGSDMFWNGKTIVDIPSETCTFVTNTSNSRYLTITTPSGFPSMSAGYYVRLTGNDIRDLWMRVMSQSGNTLVVDTDGDATLANSLPNKTCYIARYANLTDAPFSAGVTAVGDGAMQNATYANYCTARWEQHYAKQFWW